MVWSHIEVRGIPYLTSCLAAAIAAKVNRKLTISSHWFEIQGSGRRLHESAAIQVRGEESVDERRIPHMGDHRRSVEQRGGTPRCQTNIQAAKLNVLPFLKLPLPRHYDAILCILISLLISVFNQASSLLIL